MHTSVMKGNHKSWDEYLTYIEFAYNREVHKTTNISPFEVVYGLILTLIWICYLCL